MDEKKKIDRREFIKDLSLIGLGLAITPTLANISSQKTSAQNISKIVIAQHPDATVGVRLQSDIVNKVVNAGIMQYTGKDSIEEAWLSVLPSLSPSDIVTIKVNCINSSLSSHPEVIHAITDGLISAGVKDNNIIVWDRTNWELRSAGYNINTGETGIRYFGTDENGWGYDKQVKVGNQNVRLSKILMKTDHLINVPLLKDHGISVVTLSMKNHYGSVNNPGNLHGNECDPYIAELNNVPEIKEKTRLIVVDGFLGIYRGGPGGSPQFAYNSVIVGQDTVAVDYQGWKILEAERQKHGQGISRPKQLETAAKLGIGTDDPNNMALEIINIKEQFAVFPAGKFKSTWGKVKGGK